MKGLTTEDTEEEKTLKKEFTDTQITQNE